MTVQMSINCFCSEEKVWSLCWHPNGNILATCGQDKCTRIWFTDFKKFDCKNVLDSIHKRTIRNCCFSPCGKKLACASFDSTISIYDTDGFVHVATLEGHENEAKSIDWNSDGSLLASCSRDKSVWIWESLDDYEFECMAVLQEHTQDVKMVKWHPNEEVLVSCSYDDTIRVWKNLNSDWYSCLELKDHESTVWALDFDKTGRFLVSCSDDRSIRVWNFDVPESAHLLSTQLDAHEMAIYSISWSKTCDLIASVGADGTICLWSWTDQLTIFRKIPFAHGIYEINCVSWNPKFDYFATCGDDGLVKIWNLL